MTGDFPFRKGRPRPPEDPPERSPEQELLSLLDRPEIPLAVLSGPAGSGKTTLTAAFIREAGVRGKILAITAPTHKALRVLRGILNQAGPSESPFTFTTLHSLLGLRLTENEDGSFSLKSAQIPDLSVYDWVIVDECSMVGQNLLGSLEKARGDCRILFVGDPHQLPPVEAVSFSAGSPPPVFTQPFHRIFLDRVHRQEDAHPVHQLTRSLLAWKPGEKRPDLAPIFSDPEMASTDFSDSRQLFWIPGGVREAAAWSDTLRKGGENVRILAYTNRRVELYNKILFRLEYGDLSTPFARDEKVFMNETTGLRNDEDQIVLIVPAGEELTVLEIFPERHPDYAEIPAHRVFLSDESGTTFSVLVPDDSAAHQKKIDGLFREVRKMTEDAKMKRQAVDKTGIARLSGEAWSLKRAFSQLRHGYSLTVFKAQGSTFDSVILDWQDLNFFREDHAFVRGLYVAATRPRNRLILAGSAR